MRRRYRGDTVEIQGRYRGDVVEVQGSSRACRDEAEIRWRCGGDTGEIQGRYSGDTGQIQGRYRGDTGLRPRLPRRRRARALLPRALLGRSCRRALLVRGRARARARARVRRRGLGLGLGVVAPAPARSAPPRAPPPAWSSGRYREIQGDRGDIWGRCKAPPPAWPSRPRRAPCPWRARPAARRTHAGAPAQR